MQALAVLSLVLSLLLPGTFGITGFNLGSLIVAFIGAVILLFIVKLFTGRSRRLLGRSS